MTTTHDYDCHGCEHVELHDHSGDSCYDYCGPCDAALHAGMEGERADWERSRNGCQVADFRAATGSGRLTVTENGDGGLYTFSVSGSVSGDSLIISDQEALLLAEAILAHTSGQHDGGP